MQLKSVIFNLILPLYWPSQISREWPQNSKQTNRTSKCLMSPLVEEGYKNQMIVYYY